MSKALSIIHSRYAEDLDVEGLAREAGVSRTVLGEKFAELIGEPPMRYCARWRMRMAANMLRDGKQNASNVAYSVGFNSEAAFTRAFKREYGVPPATWRRQFEEDAKSRDEAQRIGLPKQLVRHAMAKDGTRLAYSVMGEGPPLVKAANWLNHLEHDWKSPVWRHWLHEFTRGHTLIRYDERANGLSDWDTPEISFDAFVDDLECVVETTGLESFDLLGISQGAAVAIAYAVRHPEKVRRLLILGGYSAGWAARGDPGEIARREALLKLTEVGWGSDHPTYRQVFTSLYIPEGTPEQINWWNEMQRVSCSPENAVKLQRALSLIDVRDLLPKVTVPTLIFHSRDDQVVPFTAGEYLAEHIPGATFVPLEGENHVLLEKEPAWTAFTRLARRFLKPEESSAAAAHSNETLRVPALVRPGIRHCTGADGTRLAFAISGDDGPPLIKVPNWFNHLEEDWGSPVWCDWIEWLSNGRRLLRYDGRGHGASDRAPARISPEGFVEDLGDGRRCRPVGHLRSAGNWPWCDDGPGLCGKIPRASSKAGCIGTLGSGLAAPRRSAGHSAATGDRGAKRDRMGAGDATLSRNLHQALHAGRDIRAGRLAQRGPAQSRDRRACRRLPECHGRLRYSRRPKAYQDPAACTARLA